MPKMNSLSLPVQATGFREIGPAMFYRMNVKTSNISDLITLKKVRSRYET